MHGERIVGYRSQTQLGMNIIRKAHESLRYKGMYDALKI